MRKPNPNDCGVAWRKTNNLGEYYSISLDLEMLLTMTGGATDKVNLSMYPIVSDNPKAPDFQLKYYPKGGPPAPTPQRDPKPDDDDIPF
jgi:hypothetical protein